MSTYCVQADHFVLADRLEGAGCLVIEDGLFGEFVDAPPEGMEVVDRSGSWVVPGFVDTHIHGFVGQDAMSCGAEGIEKASLALARAGTTSWTPTPLTGPIDQIGDACEAIYEAASARKPDSVAARVQGIFLEGPFFSERYKGAQNPAYLCDPDVEVFRGWQARAHGLICRSALAPEREGSLRYIGELINMGVATALGHSAATFDEAVCAVGAGANSFVHVYNAMSPLHHREPGMVGCAFATPAFCELIGDGRHVVYGAAAALVNAKGWDHVALITDCLPCGGLENGNYELGGLPIVLEDGLARLAADGTIAGSAITLDVAVRNIYDWGIANAEQSVRMATEVPARMSLIDDVCGSIAPGRLADFNVLGRGLVLQETYIGGRLVPRA